MRLRAGVVGAGAMGAHHARNLAALADVALVAVADPHLERAGALASELGAAALERPEALIGAVDLVIVASPAVAHAPLARLFLDADIHTLVEKPLATSLEDARGLVCLARARGLVLQGGHLLRFHAGFASLQAEVPRPRALSATRLGRSTRVSDVGVVLDLMIHDLDLALLLLGEAPATVSASGLRLGAHEAQVEAELRWASGASARLSASRLASHVERRIEVTGEDSTYTLDFADWPEENPLRAELAHFVACVRGAAPRYPLEADLAALALALRVRGALPPAGRSSDAEPLDLGAAALRR